jgi:hypothetical protein
MRDPNYKTFWEMLPSMALLANRHDVVDGFRHQYREEIIGLLTMLQRIGLFGGATELHSDPPLACDICVIPIEERQWFVAGQVGEGTWASMCPKCFYERGHSIGWGRGQLYWKIDDYQWRLVSGGHPKANESGVEDGTA